MDTWGGWVFVNMDPDAEPLLDYLDPMPTRLVGYKLEDMRIAWYKSVVVGGQLEDRARCLCRELARPGHPSPAAEARQACDSADHRRV